MITKEEVERFQLTYDTLKIQERVLRASAVTGITIEEVARSLSVDIDLPVQERLKSWPKSSMRVIVHLIQAAWGVCTLPADRRGHQRRRLRGIRMETVRIGGIPPL